MFDINTLLEIELKSDDDFLKVRETLTRIGVASKKEKTLYQSCHILHKQGRYFIVHFKELFSLDGKTSNFSESDIARRNTIALLLEEWGLVRLLNYDDDADTASIGQIKVISFGEKKDWNLVTKYNLGKRLPS